MASFAEARRTASAVPAAAACSRALAEAVGCVLAEPVRARLDVPHAATSAMDGWALGELLSDPLTGRGDGARWTVRPGGAEGPGTLLEPLEAGQAVGVVTGSPVPEGAVSVLRSEHALVEEGVLRAVPETSDLEAGRNIRPRGVEARRGDLILEAGRALTAAGAAAAAVAGYDTLQVIPAPRVRLILTGGEVITSGLPGPGQVRDVFGLALPAMLAEAGAELEETHRIEDDQAALQRLLEQPGEDGRPELIITTGGTAASRADTLRPVLERLGAEILVESVDMRPGHPALLARLGEESGPGPHVLGLPGNPLAGFAALTVLGVPLMTALSGREAPGSFSAPVAEEVPAAGARGRSPVRLLPARLRQRRQPGTGAAELVPMEHTHAHMMRGLAEAEVFAVVPSGGLAAGESAECLEVLGRSPLQRSTLLQRDILRRGSTAERRA